MNNDKKILILAGKGFSTNVIFQAIHQVFGVHAIVLEQKEPTKKFLQRRIKKLGYFETAGQLAFQALVVPVLRSSASKYVQSLREKQEIQEKPIHHKKLYEVTSVNELSVAQIIQDISPDVVVVNGTRIISKKILTCIQCPVINMHAGITPRYRGVHGAYWALVSGDKAHCGLTVHLVDAGVDTGEVLFQQTIETHKEDNFTTYPIKQLYAGIPLLLKAIENALEGNLSPYRPDGPSQQWYHPTIWQYLYQRFKNGIK